MNNSKQVVNMVSTTKGTDITVAPIENGELFLPYYKKEVNFVNNGEYVKFIKSVENLIRRSKEYKAYIAYLKQDIGLNKCMVYGNIDDEKAPIEMHHGPIFNLFDYVEITLIHFFKTNNELVSTFHIADQVLKDHFDNIIQVVMLSEMVHIAAHPKKKEQKPEFINIDSAWGDLIAYLNKYSNCLNYTHIHRIRRYVEEYEKRNSNNNDTISVFKNVIKNHI